MGNLRRLNVILSDVCNDYFFLNLTIVSRNDVVRYPNIFVKS